MKKGTLILTALVLAALTAFVFGSLDGSWFTRDIPFESIASGTDAPVAAAEDGSLLLKLSCRGMILPENDDGTVLIPSVPETGLIVTAARGTEVTKTQAAGHRWRITGVSKTGTRSVTLIETGIAVAQLDLNGLELNYNSDPIRNKNKQSYIRMLSADENGDLRLEQGAVRIKLRGNISRVYWKKSITVTNEDGDGNPVARSFLGLPADTKFGFNSMYEDDVKLRDILSLELWQNMLPAEKRRETIRMRYCELYINGLYWGLYAFQQVVSPDALGLSENDGLVRILPNYLEDRDLRQWTSAIKIVRDMPDGKLATDLLEALALLKEDNEAGLGYFDRETLFRYALFLQFTNAKDNAFKNMAVSRHADTNLYTLIAYDTDQTFALRWDPFAPLNMKIIPETSMQDRFSRNYPLDGLTRMSPEVTRSLAELWFTLRKDVITEETLMGRAKELFSLVTESGAMERDRLRWPGGYYTDSLDVIGTYIAERIPWCDDYFGRFLEDGPAGA